MSKKKATSQEFNVLRHLVNPDNYVQSVRPKGFEIAPQGIPLSQTIVVNMVRKGFITEDENKYTLTDTGRDIFRKYAW